VIAKAIASHVRPSERYPATDTADVDVSLEVGTERQAVLLLVGQVAVARQWDGSWDVVGGETSPIEGWASATLMEDLRCLPAMELARALVELRRAAVDACQGGTHV